MMALMVLIGEILTAWGHTMKLHLINDLSRKLNNGLKGGVLCHDVYFSRFCHAVSLAPFPLYRMRRIFFSKN